MSVSSGQGNQKGATPHGLDQALNLIAICKDPHKYEEMLLALEVNRDQAKEAWEKVEIVGEIEDIYAEAVADREAAEALLAASREAEREKADTIDKQHAEKVAALNKREQEFTATQTKAAAALTARETEVANTKAQLGRQSTKLVADQRALAEAQAKLERDQAELERRLAPFKEVIIG